MEVSRFRPRVQLFVCVHARAAGDPLKSACGERGPGVYAALKREVASVGRVSDVWVTRALCLGHCPPDGCSVAVYPEGAQLRGVTEGDAPGLARRYLAGGVTR